MERYAITNVTVFNGYKFMHNRAVVINGNLIEDIVKMPELKGVNKQYDYKGNTLSAGFIDLQINGCGGVLFNDDISEKTLEIMHKTCLKFGCTSFVPTLITATEDEIRKAIDVGISFYRKNPNAILGMHIEGPYISHKKRGTHNPSFIKPIDEKMTEYFCEKTKEIPLFLTLAPEENDIKHIRRLAQAGVNVSMGHTNATYEQAAEGIANGIRMATHLFNAMSPFESREPGVVGAVLNTPVYTGIITDGMHSSFNAVNLVKKIKQDRLYIVTDAATPMGTDMKEFYFGGFKVNVIDGKCINEEGALAGSNIDMASSVYRCVDCAGIPADEALRMATLYPARAAKCELELGAVQPGMIANLAIFDQQYNVVQSIFNGVQTR